MTTLFTVTLIVGFTCAAAAFGLMVVDMLTDFRWRAVEKAVPVTAFIGFLTLLTTFCIALLNTL